MRTIGAERTYTANVDHRHRARVLWLPEQQQACRQSQNILRGLSDAHCCHEPSANTPHVAVSRRVHDAPLRQIVSCNASRALRRETCIKAEPAESLNTAVGLQIVAGCTAMPRDLFHLCAGRHTSRQSPVSRPTTATTAPSASPRPGTRSASPRCRS